MVQNGFTFQRNTLNCGQQGQRITSKCVPQFPIDSFVGWERLWLTSRHKIDLKKYKNDCFNLTILNNKKGVRFKVNKSEDSFVEQSKSCDFDEHCPLPVFVEEL